MKTVIRYRHVAKLSRPDLHQMIERLADRVLGPHLSHFPAELLRLHATLDRSRHHGSYRVRLQMTLPGATLVCAEESSRLEKAIEHALTDLDRQVERHVAHLRHEDAWRRKERRVGLRQLKTALNEESDAEAASFSSLVRPLLASLRRFVQRELSDLQARGELDPGVVVSERELRALLARLLSELPAPWRRGVVLCRLEALSVSAAAEVAGVTAQELEQGLAHADAFLRARLRELRLIPQASDEPAGYVTPGVLQPASSLSQKFEQATLRDLREPEKQR
ncbi:hypothetical protein A9R05_38925 (plasmid) [Burkholderia sp. KK1]|nr:hypothetical protein A9R05_38925 [Burkholderia sp. KK1]